MKKTLFLIPILALGILFTACKKDDTKKATVEGFWSGKLSIGLNDPTTNYGILFRNDGTMRVYLNFTDTATSNKTDGTYAIANNDVVTGDYGNFRIKATANGDFSYMQGSWGNKPSNANGGSFFLAK